MPYQGVEFTQNYNPMDDLIDGVRDAFTKGAHAAFGVLTDQKSAIAVATGYALGNLAGAGTAAAGVAVTAGVTNLYVSTKELHGTAIDIVDGYNSGKYNWVQTSHRDAPRLFFKGVQDDGDNDYFVFETSRGQTMKVKDLAGTSASSCELITEGNNSHELLDGCGAVNITDGNGGNDVIRLYGANDRGYGHDGHDDVFGGNGNDYVSGGAGNDYLNGGTGNDKLVAGTGTDKLYGGTGRDTHYIDGGDYIFDLDTADGDRVSTTGSARIITGVQTTETDRLLSLTTATNDKITFDTDHLSTGNDGWTLKEAQWFADTYVFL